MAQPFLFRTCTGIAIPGHTAQASMPAPPEVLSLCRWFIIPQGLLSLRVLQSLLRASLPSPHFFHTAPTQFFQTELNACFYMIFSYTIKSGLSNKGACCASMKYSSGTRITQYRGTGYHSTMDTCYGKTSKTTQTPQNYRF